VGDIFVSRFNQLSLYDNQRDSARPQVLLCSRIDQTKLAHVDRAAHDVARHISHNGYPRAIGELKKLGTHDRVVAANVKISGTGITLYLVIFRHTKELVAYNCGRRFTRLSCKSSFFECLLSPDVGCHIVGALTCWAEVHRHLGELLRRATLKEKYLVTFGYEE